MKISLVREPATITPAMYIPGTVEFQCLGIADGTHLIGGQFDACAAQEIVIGMVAGEREDEIIFRRRRPEGVRSTTQSSLISSTVLLKCAVIRPALMRFSISGSHPVFERVLRICPRPRWTRRDARAVSQHRSSAAIRRPRVLPRRRPARR